MTIITREQPTDLVVRPVRPRRPRQDVRPRSDRPHGGGLPSGAHRGTGVLMSRASHRRRPLTPTGTVVLAVVAGAITLWLGFVAQLSGPVAEAPATVPTRFAVVQVQAGETLHQLAARVAPEAPAAAVVEEIRELNKLNTSAVNVGQTLIAPVG